MLVPPGPNCRTALVPMVFSWSYLPLAGCYLDYAATIAGVSATWLKIFVLGRVIIERLTADGSKWETVEVSTDETLDLLILLAAAEEGISRADAIELIKGHSHYADQITYDWARSLRQDLDDGRPNAQGVIPRKRNKTISLNRAGGVWVDYDDFRQLRDDDDHRAALALVRGDLGANVKRRRLDGARAHLLAEINDSRQELGLPSASSVKKALAGLSAPPATALPDQPGAVGPESVPAREAGRQAAPDAAGVDGSLSLHQNIVRMLKAEFARNNYSDVIRIGEALSRPFFEAGSFSVRLDIGRMVEEAAARSARKREQYVALIDSIGWSLVELGEYGPAAREIKHGLKLLKNVSDPFYEAKAHRHLGVIARRERRYGDARSEYEKARERAQEITDERDSLAMTAGLEYALGSLALHEDDLETAATRISSAIEGFSSLGDEYRLNMALIMRGDIEFRRDDPDDARDTYRLVLQNADRNKETLQYVRACLGLADVRVADKRWDEVDDALALLNDLDLDEYKAEQDRLAEIRKRISAIRVRTPE